MMLHRWIYKIIEDILIFQQLLL